MFGQHRRPKSLGSITQRGNRYRIRFTIRGRRQDIPNKATSMQEAEQVLHSYVTHLDKRILSSKEVTLAEIASDLIANYEEHGYTTIRDPFSRFRTHILPFFGTALAMEISTAWIQAFARKRLSEGASQGEVDNELSHIKAAYYLAMEKGKIEWMPYIRIKRPTKGRQIYFNQSQFEAVSGYLHPDIQPLFRFMLLTGWRVGEVQNLLWRNIDFEGEEIQIIPELNRIKNKEPKIFFITLELRKILESQLEKTRIIEQEQGIQVPWVFHRRGKQIMTFWREFDTARNKAGLEHLWRHDLRRTAARRFDRMRIRPKVICKLLGWKDSRMLDRYNIITSREVRAAGKRMDRIAQRKSSKVSNENSMKVDQSAPANTQESKDKVPNKDQKE